MYTLNMHKIHAFRTLENPHIMGFILVYLFPWTSTETLTGILAGTISCTALLTGRYVVPPTVSRGPHGSL